MAAGLGEVSNFGFQYIPRVEKEKSELPSVRTGRAWPLRRKLEVSLLIVFVSGVSLALWVASLVLLAAFWSVRRFGIQ